MRGYARRFGEDEELWGCVALLHDFDYEIHPTLDKHPQDGAPILREEGYPEIVIRAVLSHAEHLELPRDTQLEKTLFACDELSGLRPRLRARAADRARRPRAEVGAEEAQAAVLRGRRAPRRGLRGRRAARARARRAHRERRSRRCSRSRPSSGSAPPPTPPSLTPSAVERGDEAVEVVVARPPAARDPDEPAARELADVDAGRVEPSTTTSAGSSPSGRKLTSVARSAGVTTSTRAESSSRHRSAAVRTRARSTTRDGARAPRASPGACPATTSRGSKRARARLRLEARRRGRTRSARSSSATSTREPLGVADDERARRVRAAEPLLARDREEVESVRRRSGSRRPTGRRRRAPARRSRSRAPRAGAPRRSSRAPARTRSAASAA